MIDHFDGDQPSPWVARFAALIAPGGRVLDLACGGGRHTRLLAARGFELTAVDRDAAAIARVAADPRVRTLCADIEGGPWPLSGETFQAIVVTNYLHRPLFPLLRGALDAGAVLIYETFMVGNERLGKPSNPAFLLRPNELLEQCAGLGVIAFEQGEVDELKPAMVQRICAINAPVDSVRIP